MLLINDPLHCPKQVTSVTVGFGVNGKPVLLRVTVVFSVHPFASVTLTGYKPAALPSIKFVSAIVAVPQL